MKNVVNDFTINVATANGTGSQSANLVLLDAFFRMGLPVSGKNLFPSNIAGLPTWYILRVSARGYQAPGDVTHIQVLMNPDTWLEDLATLPSGAVVVFNSDVNDVVERDDLVLYGAPMTTIAREFNPKLAKMVTNIVFVGMLAELLGIPQKCLDAAIEKQFAGKQKAIDLNTQAAVRGRDYVRDELEKRDPYRVEPLERDETKFLIEGNNAVALGSLYGGVAMVSWYPITPSSSLAETIENYLPQLRTGDDGATCAVIQAEDEIAAIGMVVGAGWAGVRAMTCTSGPGISLMSEIIGLAYYVEVPAVIWDVNRVGPSTGMPTRTQQSDVISLYRASHGDTQHPVLIPGTAEECFEFGWRALDCAERLQTVVFGFSDLDLGMNHWVCSNFTYPEKLDRGKVVRTQEQLDAFEEYGRYLDVDGDGICWRTLPGSGLAPYLARGTGRNEKGVYSERPEDYRKNMVRLKRKIEGARDTLPKPVLREEPELQLGIIYYGSMENSIQEIDAMLEADGLKVSQCRVRALPLHSEVEEFVRRHEMIIVLEINRDGQMYKLMRAELPSELVPRLRSVAYSDGIPPRAQVYTDAICAEIQKFEAA